MLEKDGVSLRKIVIYLKLIRVKHYIKNFLLFVPMIFANVFTKSNLKTAIIGFLSFSLMASVIYIINDIRDVKNDRNHPTKKNRPIASGEVPIVVASIVAFILFILSLLVNYFIKERIIGYSLLMSYFCFNLFYSFGLKKLPIVDVMLLVSFYILRIYYGGAIVGVTISDWLLLTVTFAASYLTFGKRRNELVKTKDTRDVLKFYSKEFLDKFMYLSLALTLVFYSLWVIEQHVKYLPFSVLILFVIFLKYSLIVEGESDGDPTEIILKDKVIVGLVLFYFIFVFIVMR